MDHYGERIRAERLRLKLTQTEFAKAVGISQGTQVGYESGARLPNIQYLTLAAGLGVDVMYLIFGKPGKTAAMDMLDWELQTTILKVVERWLDKHQVVLSVEKKMRLVRIFFDKYNQIEEIDYDDIDQTLADVA